MLGLFVRKIHLAFSKASFASLSRLYSNLCQYLTSTNEGDEEEEEHIHQETNDPLSPYEYERLIQKEIIRIESMCLT